jgi:hypothetical protein
MLRKRWPATLYGNFTSNVAYNNLPGNALFIYVGHADYRGLHFYNSTWSWTYLLDYPQAWYWYNYPTYFRRYISGLSWDQLHDLRFALLAGCLTGCDAWGSNISTAFIEKGVDTVFGLTGYASYSVPHQPWCSFYLQHIWNQEFWRYSQIRSSNIVQSAESATHWVLEHAGQYNGWNAWVIYGKYWEYINKPMFGD